MQSSPNATGLSLATSGGACVVAARARFVQVRNPKIGAYVKIDREVGEFLSVKGSKGPYKNVPIARLRKS